MKVVVNFIISDTWGEHLPRADKRRGYGTDLAMKFDSVSKAVDMANKLAYLTAGEQWQIFDADEVRRQRRTGAKRLAWSNSLRTHHCELLFDGEWTHYSTAIKREGVES